MTAATAGLSWVEMMVRLDIADLSELGEQVEEIRYRRSDMLVNIKDIQEGTHRPSSEKLRAVALARDEIDLCEAWLRAHGEPFEVPDVL